MKCQAVGQMNVFTLTIVGIKPVSSLIRYQHCDNAERTKIENAQVGRCAWGPFHYMSMIDEVDNLLTIPRCGRQSWSCVRGEVVKSDVFLYLFELHPRVWVSHQTILACLSCFLHQSLLQHVVPNWGCLVYLPARGSFCSEETFLIGGPEEMMTNHEYSCKFIKIW